MTFEKLIKLLNILDNDGEILVMEDLTDGQADYDDEHMRKVNLISKYSDISDCMQYFTDASRYHLFIYKKDEFYGDMEEL